MQLEQFKKMRSEIEESSEDESRFRNNIFKNNGLEEKE
jgi:hypothetical protein